ncbi:hypothetical protein BU200_08850 [Streptococcus acidominimus]|uniref:Lactococcin 972 family bacteriocin n=1 Tax=Streptococcus acidominimus TaxID=1326 RepID=A0A1Q8EBJ3_STRAI|nr:hypothetical protein BU200_08850 [Streptococcus acidominimus]
MSTKTLALLAVSAFSIGFATTVSAAVAHPAPDPIIDEWHYEVDGNYGYSNYYVKSPNDIGSKSSVTNYWGSIKATDSKRYGWALSSATKDWNDIRLNAYWDYFRF